MSNTTLHRADFVVPIASDPIADGAVAVRDGTIVWVGPYSKRARTLRDLPPEQLIEYGHVALLPGFVNPHSHVVFHYQRGLRDGQPMLDWLRHAIVKVDWSDAERNEAACVAGFREGLAAGITTWGDNHFLLAPMRAAIEVGVRATCFLEIFGVMGNLEHEEASLKRRLAEAADLATAKVCCAISPHAVYTVPPPLLDLCAALSRTAGHLLSIHLAENPEERDFLNSTRGSLRRWIGKTSTKLIPPTSSSFTTYLKEHGLLTERTLIVHGVHLNDVELKEMAKAHATLVHCPVSNARLRCGIAPVELALRRGVRLALGTDGVASGERHDPFETMRLALLLQEATHHAPGRTTAAAILRAATLGGAEALHRDHEIGSLSAGKRADLVALALPEVPAHPNRPIEDEIVYGGERSWVRGVWIDGIRMNQQNRERQRAASHHACKKRYSMAASGVG